MPSFLWLRVAPTRPRAILISLFFVLAVLRFAAAIVSAVHFNGGDFQATLPGFYAEQWNLTLWDNPDLEGVGFHRHGYGYGPTQYLTLWPIVFLDSYRQIAAVLLPLYVVIVIGIAYLLWRLCETLVPRGDGCRLGHAMTVVAAVCLFGPTQAALAAREFETVQVLVVVAGAYAVARGRPVLAAWLLGYISMFKYWPVAFGGYFALKRQWKPVVTFIVTVAAVLLVAHAVFDLARFPFAGGSAFDLQFARIYKPLDQKHQFCAEPTGTAASVRMGVCAVTGGRDRVAKIMFWGLLGAAGSLFAAMFILFERRARFADDIERRWRSILEFCLIMIAAGAVFHAHYYYLSVLMLPLTLVLYKSLWHAAGIASTQLALALLAYAALSPFIVPISLFSRAIGGDAWQLYLSHGIYLYGDAILVGLLFWEYWSLLKRAEPAAGPGAAVEAAL